MFVKLSIVAAIAALVNAAPKPVPHVLHEKRETSSADWIKGARIEKDAVIPMRIGLTQTNLENGYDLLMDVSHPDSKNYGKHWTAQQVHDMFAPEEETVANVMNWLTDFGIHDGRIVHSENKGWIAVDVTVEEAEALLLTEFHEHEHAYSSKIRVGCDKYHVPEHIAPHIDFITPGIKLSPVVKRTVKRTPEKREEKKKAKRASGSKKGAAAVQGDAVKAAPAAITSPPSCGGNSCDRAFDQQYTASFSNLESFCSSWTAAPSDIFAATGTASWAANCIGTSTAAAQETAIASKVSSACSCFVPATTTTSAAAGPTGCAQYVSVGCWRELYSIPTGTLKSPGLGLGLYEQGSYIVLEDIDLYWKTYAPEVPQGTYPINGSIDGGVYAYLANSTAFNSIGEASLDLEITQSLIYPQNVTLYQVDDPYWAEQDLATTNLWNDFLDALDGSYCTYTAYGETGNSPTIDPIYPDTTHPDGYLGQLECGIYKPTPVISMSYGQAESDLPANYTKRTCNEFMKLGLQGISVVASSGDFGVASFPNDFGTAGSSGCLGPEGKIFNPQFPSTCPYVISVGGTQIQGTQILPDGSEPGPFGTVHDPETVMIDNLGGANVNFSSAGGFSNYFPRPTYQDGHVQDFFHQASTQAPYPYYTELEVDVSTTTGVYSRNGRAYPDVAANGAWMPLFIDGVNSADNGGAYFGTSLAAPIFASVLALINEELAVAGKPTVGFVNPVLYRNDAVLTDIKLGHNVGCGTEGWNAISGWDPATGLGTPNYPKMLELFMSL